MKRHAAEGEGRTRLRRRANLRTALILMSIAIVLFGGVIYAQYSGEAATGIGVTGFAVLGFLLAAILRNRGRRGAP